MSFTDLRRAEIKKYILRKIAGDDADLIEKVMDAFDVSVTTVKRYLCDEEREGHIIRNSDAACGYHLVTQEYCVELSLQAEKLEEDRIYAEHIVPFLEGGKKAKYIWNYVCSEILNNAIEHSQGTMIKLILHKNSLFSSVVVMDDGIGAYRTLMEGMRKSGWKSPSVEDALIELYKGRLTSAPECHSGEGIFFSSKMTDKFMLWSDAVLFRCGGTESGEMIKSHLLAYAARIQKLGTLVFMQLENETRRDITEVFDMYANVEDGFFRTRIPVLETCVTGEPMARSQARRICNRLDEFKEVILDFSRVTFMGQGFADEIFRVYAKAHPEVKLIPENMNINVEKMFRQVVKTV